MTLHWSFQFLHLVAQMKSCKCFYYFFHFYFSYLILGNAIVALVLYRCQRLHPESFRLDTWARKIYWKGRAALEQGTQKGYGISLDRQNHSWPFLMLVIAQFHVGIDLHESHWPPPQPALLSWKRKCCDSIKQPPSQRAVHKDNLPGELVGLDLMIFRNCSISHQHPVI